MRELTYFVAASVDGYIAAPTGGDPTDTSPGGFLLSQGDHSVPLLTAYPETVPGSVRRALGLDADNRVFDTVVMGRATWQVGVDHGTTNPYPRLRTVVFSRAMTSPDPEVTFSSDPPVDVVRRLKQQAGLGIWLCGGGELAGQLWSEIDRVVVKINPVVLGSGIKLLGQADFDVRRLALTSSRVFDSGVAVMEYRVSAPQG